MDVLLVPQEVWLDLQDQILVVSVLLESLLLMEFIVMIVQLVLTQKRELMERMHVCPVLKEARLGLLVHQAAQLVLMDMCLLMDTTVSKISLGSNLNGNEVNLMFV